VWEGVACVVEQGGVMCGGLFWIGQGTVGGRVGVNDRGVKRCGSIGGDGGGMEETFMFRWV